MLDIIKEPFNINVHHKVQSTALYEFVNLCDGVFCTSTWAKTVIPFMEFRLTNWLHYLEDALLYQSVHDGRNTQRSCFTVGFWNFHTSYQRQIVKDFLIKFTKKVPEAPYGS